LPLVKLVLPRVLAVPGLGKEIVVEASTLKDVIDALISIKPEFSSKLLDSSGRLRGIFSVYVNGRNAELLNGLETRLREGDEITIIPSVAGG